MITDFFYVEENEDGEDDIQGTYPMNHEVHITNIFTQLRHEQNQQGTNFNINRLSNNRRREVIEVESSSHFSFGVKATS